VNRVFVDTSGWYAYARADDPAHDGARTALELWEGRLVTTDYVFDETVTLTRARLGVSAAAKLGDALRDAGVVELVRLLPEDFDDAWELFKKNRDKPWSFTDCTSFAVMRRLRLHAAVATDKHFRQAGFETLAG